MAVFFPQFVRLPLEIRLMIWALALPPARIVELKEKRMKFNAMKIGAVLAPRSRLTSAQSPTWLRSIASTCQESCQAVSRSYAKIFATHEALPDTYFHFRRDTLYIKPSFILDRSRLIYGPIDPLLSVTDTETFGRVENLAILVDQAELGWDIYGDTSATFLISILRTFTNLKNFTFVLLHYLTNHLYEPYVFTDPIGLLPAPAMYRNLMVSVGGMWSSGPGVGLWSGLDLREVELQRAKSVQEGGSTWKIPNIHYKVAVPSSNMDHEALYHAGRMSSLGW